MFKDIFSYEIKCWLRKWSYHFYLIIFCLIAFLVFAGSAGFFDAPTNLDSLPQYLNSPFEINFVLQYLSKFFLFLLPTLIGATIYKDYKNNAHSVLYSFPIKKSEYLLGKFLSSFLLVCTIVFMVVTAIIIAEHLPNLHPNKIGYFNIYGYLQVLLIYVIPNMLFFGAIVFALVTHFRNIYIGFIVIIILFFLQSIIENALSGNDFLVAVLDPFAQNAVAYETQHWTLNDKNTKLIPILGTVLYNRIFWFIISALIFSVAYKKFRFSENASESLLINRKRKRIAEINVAPKKVLVNTNVAKKFNVKSKIKQSINLAQVDFCYIIKNWMFYVIVVLGLLTVLFAIGKVTNKEDITILPITNIVLAIPAFFFTTIIILLTFIYSGMLLNRSVSSNMNALVDSSPVSNWSLLVSKFIAIIKMQLLLLFILMVAGVSIQVYNKFYNFEMGLYLFNLFIIQFSGLAIWVITSLFIHTLFKNTYLGLFALILLWLGVSGLEQIGIQTKLLKFNFFEPLAYSDLTGFGSQLKPFFLVKSYWFCIAILLFILTYLLWNRGLVETFNKRLIEAKKLVNNKLTIILSIWFLAFVSLGYSIYSDETKSQELSSSKRNKAFSNFEKSFDKYKSIKVQPRVTSIDLNIEVYPNKNNFTIEGNYWLVNKSNKAIDTLLIKTGFDEITEFSINKSSKIVDADDYVKFYVLELKNKLQPKDSLRLTFSMKSNANTLFDNNSNVYENGTYFKNDILPRIGYFLNDKEKHPNDSTSRNQNYYSQDSDYLNFKTTISTSKDEIAIAPGYLVNNWTQDNRNYFQYNLDTKIKNSLSFNSGKYTIYEENYKGVLLQIYHHKNHDYNLNEMMEALKASLDYNTKHFGKYQYKEARIIEYPITEGTYASVMANSIPTSELRFITNTSSDKIDIAFYSIAHELTHQWWGNQIMPADALGAVMLTESITEYITLNIFKNKYGKTEAKRFLKLQRERYLRGRTKEQEKESSLMLVKGEQQYISYGKGAIVFNNLEHYLGKDKLHKCLKDFFDKHKYKEAPYPTSLDLIKKLKKAAPDSLQYILTDNFETVTFYDNRVNNVKTTNQRDSTYKLEIDFEVKKYRDTDSEKLISLSDYIQIGFYGDENKLIETKLIRVNKTNNQKEFILNQKPVKVVIDPNFLLIEKDINNNVFRVD